VVFPDPDLDQVGVRVKLFATSAGILQALRSYGVPRPDPRIEAACCLLDPPDEEQACAELYLHVGQLTAGVIAHECFHATLRWAWTNDVMAVPTDGDATEDAHIIEGVAVEERLATFHGDLVQAIVEELDQRGWFDADKDLP